MATYAIVTEPVSQMLFSFVHLHLEVVWLSLYTVCPHQLSMIVHNVWPLVVYYVTSRCEEDLAVIVTFW